MNDNSSHNLTFQQLDSEDEEDHIKSNSILSEEVNTKNNNIVPLLNKTTNKDQ